jgi:hypothetical protein
MPGYVSANGSAHDKDFADRLQAGTGFDDEIGAGAGSAHVDSASGKPATPATKAKMASRILATAAAGVTDAGKLQSAAIEEGLCPAD